MAALGGSPNGLSGLPSSSSSSSSSWYLSRNSRAINSLTSPSLVSSISINVSKSLISRGCIASSSTAAAATETKAAPVVEKKAVVKPKAAAKAPVKPLRQMMEEDIIPPLKTILEAQEDLSELQLSFDDNKLEGSFLKEGIPHSFWAFFPDGNLTGPKGFSLSSYGSEASTVEPFLVDEKKITAKFVVFWVEKRLAAQGVIPVWTEKEEEKEE